MEKKKYPIGSENYVLYEVVGHGASASVYRATCIPLNETVAIKILDFERHGTDLSNLSREAQTMILVDHPNILKAYCTFVADHDLWVVMPFMAGGSFLHMLKVSYEDGFEEVVIATILREALKGLEYLHQHGHIHRDVKAGNILVDAQGAIKLGDFGVAACIFDSGDRQRTRNTFVGTPCWMAPEVMQQLQGYDFKADIWSFGITALELAHGHAPFSKYPPMKVFLMTLQNAPPGLDYERDKKFSKSLKQMIASCLVKDPSKRPTVKKLLKHSFFKKARSNEYIVRNILEGLPSLGERLKKLKMKEEDMVKQKKISDGQKEELSQNNYKQSLSGWEFDVDYLKAQASLCQDEETLTEQGETSCSSLGQGSLSSSFGVDMQDTQSESQSQPSAISQNLKDVEDIEDDDVIQNRPAHPSFGNPSRCDASDDEFSICCIAGSSCELNMSQNSLQQHHDHIENVVIEKLEMEINDRLSEGMISHPSLQFGDSSGTNVLDPVFAKEESQKQQRHHQNMVNSDGTTGQHVVGDALSDTLSIASKASGMGDDSDEKTRAPVVQQRGRFKVTSENLDLEKVTPSPMLQKSHSIQVISQLPVSSPKPSSAARSLNPPGCSLHQQLESALQSNILQREALLSVQKQVPFGGSTVNCDGGHMLTITTLTENSLPEAACDREKELLKEMTEVQQRLIRIQDELLTLKDKKCPGVNVMKCSPR